ncbi:Uncharacterized protein DAT39_008132 [Clarias magur]|uniref:Uncharacterized protein n=1 Tax=Clarias magur TaxID=1594786 RepID=A0A8J4TUP1_CLAMG|nr:Uncharacterized protein DAT39_008132 [Clarias magur]
MRKVFEKRAFSPKVQNSNTQQKQALLRYKAEKVEKYIKPNVITHINPWFFRGPIMAHCVALAVGGHFNKNLWAKQGKKTNLEYLFYYSSSSDLSQGFQLFSDGVVDVSRYALVLIRSAA